MIQIDSSVATAPALSRNDRDVFICTYFYAATRAWRKDIVYTGIERDVCVCV